MKRMRLKYYLRALGIGIIVTALLMGYSQSSQAEMTDEEILRRAEELGMTEPQTGVLAEIATASPQPVEETEPTAAPTAEPTAKPTAAPTAEPVAEPSASPEVSPSPQPDTEPTTAPTEPPVASPTVTPTTEPAATPTAKPTTEPTAKPTAEPTAAPTAKPTAAPTAAPTAKPTAAPTATPAATPTAKPTTAPAGDTVTLVISRGESSVTVSKNLQQLGLVEDYKVFDRYLCDNGYDKSISVGTYEIPVDATDEEIARIISKKR